MGVFNQTLGFPQPLLALNSPTEVESYKSPSCLGVSSGFLFLPHGGLGEALTSKGKVTA